jgi:hypothetical protein
MPELRQQVGQQSRCISRRLACWSSSSASSLAGQQRGARRRRLTFCATKSAVPPMLRVLRCLWHHRDLVPAKAPGAGSGTTGILMKSSRRWCSSGLVNRSGLKARQRTLLHRHTLGRWVQCRPLFTVAMSDRLAVLPQYRFPNSGRSHCQHDRAVDATPDRVVCRSYNVNMAGPDVASYATFNRVLSPRTEARVRTWPADPELPVDGAISQFGAMQHWVTRPRATVLNRALVVLDTGLAPGSMANPLPSVPEPATTTAFTYPAMAATTFTCPAACFQ